MVNGLFSNLVEASNFCEIGHIAVHLTIDLNVLDHFLAIGFQSAVEVVQVFDTADLPGCGVEELCRNGFRQRVSLFAVLLESAHQVVAIFLDHTVQFRNLVGWVLQVGVHRDDNISFCLLETTIQGRRLAVVATELDAFHVLWLLWQLSNDFPRTVGRTVVNEDNFKREVMLLHDTLYPRIQFRNRLVLIIKRYYYRYIHNFLFSTFNS